MTVTYTTNRGAADAGLCFEFDTRCVGQPAQLNMVYGKDRHGVWGAIIPFP